MLAFGTWAGLDLANNLHKTDTMVISASNAILSGIIKSVGDSGYDHVHAWIDPDKTKRQLRLLHKIIGFKRLGLAYENNKIGKSYAELDEMAKEMGSTLRAPYMSLSFMALLVIPSLKLSDKGLFDGNTFQFTSLEFK